MPEIVLSTLNARFIHAAFGLRYLMANLGPLQARSRLIEFDINQRPLEIVEALLALDSKIIGLGIYIWNVAPTTEVVSMLKRLRPDLFVILGGPEVSYEVEKQPIVQLADYVITGEADLKFAEVCQRLLEGNRPLVKIIPAEPPALDNLVLPYHLYDDRDVAHRIIYVEASRGCPFTCEFCLSSLDVPVRQVPLTGLVKHLQALLERGVRHFKFVDRTFNLNLNVSK
ncbi:MAG: cobalamin-dependent protein, partial [Verrucomicrobiota bacterium]